jgi:hypothetical protein
MDEEQVKELLKCMWKGIEPKRKSIVGKMVSAIQ